AGPVVDFDTALPPLEFQVEARLLTKTSFSFLAPAASSNFLPTLRVGVEADTIYGALELPGARCGLRVAARAVSASEAIYLRSPAARARISTRLSVLSASGSSGLLVVPRARRQRLTRSPSAVRRLTTTSAGSRFCLR